MPGPLSISTEKLKIGEDGSGSAFFMKGGTVSVKDDFEFFSGLLEISGGSWTSGWEGAPLEFEGGLIRVIGDGATLIDIFAAEGGGGSYEFVPNAAGGITPITSGDTSGGNLSVVLDALTAPGTMTLIQGGHSNAFLEANTSITHGATTLTLGASAGSLGLNEYFLAGQGTSDDLVLSFNIGASAADPAITSIEKSGTTVTADIDAAGDVDIFRSATVENGSWGTAIETALTPGTGVVIDSNTGGAAKAFYIAVPTGESAP